MNVEYCWVSAIFLVCFLQCWVTGGDRDHFLSFSFPFLSLTHDVQSPFILAPRTKLKFQHTVPFLIPFSLSYLDLNESFNTLYFTTKSHPALQYKYQELGDVDSLLNLMRKNSSLDYLSWIPFNFSCSCVQNQIYWYKLIFTVYWQSNTH